MPEHRLEIDEDGAAFIRRVYPDLQADSEREPIGGGSGSGSASLLMLNRNGFNQALDTGWNNAHPNPTIPWLEGSAGDPDSVGDAFSFEGPSDTVTLLRDATVAQLFSVNLVGASQELGDGGALGYIILNDDDNGPLYYFVGDWRIGDTDNRAVNLALPPVPLKAGDRLRVYLRGNPPISFDQSSTLTASQVSWLLTAF